MRLVAVCKVLDEADIIEAFARHTACYAAHQLFLDNGSIDGTAEILCKLRSEGLNLTVMQNGSRLFNEAAYNTQLLHQAISERGADWVAFLDADEFIDDRSTPLVDLLGNVSPLVLCAHVMLTQLPCNMRR